MIYKYRDKVGYKKSEVRIIMDNKSLYNDILIEHNQYPEHKHEIENPNYVLEGINPSCGDNIVLQLKINDEGVIEDGGYVGDGCAISQASCDMMLDLIIGKSKEEALRLSEIFLRMIKGKITEEEREELEEAGALTDISHMPSRVKCAVLGWHTMEEIMEKSEESNDKGDDEA